MGVVESRRSRPLECSFCPTNLSAVFTGDRSKQSACARPDTYRRQPLLCQLLISYTN